MEPKHDQRGREDETGLGLDSMKRLFSVAITTCITYSPRPMSQHPSLKGSSTIAAKRSVLKRYERVEVLKKRGQFKPGQRVIGLPKTKPDA